MIRNFCAGLKLALFLKCDAQEFRISFGSLWFIIFIYCLAHTEIDILSIDSFAKFNVYGFAWDAIHFAAFMFSGFLLSLLFKDPSFALALPIVVYNALFLPSILSRFIFWGPHEAWTGNAPDVQFFRWVQGTWYFLVSFRCLLLFTGTKAMRQLIGVTMLLAALYIPGKYIEPTAYWYKDYDESEDEDGGERLPFDLFQRSLLWAEDIMPQQPALLKRQFDDITGRAKGKNTFVTLFAGFGGQNVFLKEVLFVQQALENKLHTKGHTVLLVNNTQTVTRYPLATVANLRQTLQFLGKKADPKKDLLLLYLTSHGAASTGITVNLPNVGLRQLDGKALKALLKESGFRWKVVIIAACYSGVYVDALKDDDTVVMTAARKDRTSFGCSDELDMTYFGDAFFRRALPKSSGLLPAFDEAKKIVTKMEDDSKVTPHSEPQIYVGANIRKYLEEK